MQRLRGHKGWVRGDKNWVRAGCLKCGLAALFIVGIFSKSSPLAIAQPVVADGTLSTQVTPSADGKTFSISHLAPSDRAGNNLFHSFSEFSLSNGETAHFANPIDVTNIISRVTGSNQSIIDGTITTAGVANLFLLNPNGIILGPNAQLTIGGSFLGTTAERITFADGTEFIANSTTAQPLLTQPLLTVSLPVGLQLGPTSQDIQVNDHGYSLLPTVPPIPINLAGLRVNPGQAFVLAGSNVHFQSGVISAPAGHISLAAVQNGWIDLNPATWALNLDAVDQLGNIHLSGESLVEASGLPVVPPIPGFTDAVKQGGTVNLQGRQIVADSGAQILIQNFGQQPSGSLNVIASERVELSGLDSSGQIGSGLTTAANGQGQGGNIQISAPQLSLTQGGSINSLSTQLGRSGDITLSLSERLLVTGAAIANDGIQTITTGSGTAGNINIGNRENPVQNISIMEESITSQTFGSGDSGDINVYAENLSLVDSGSLSTVSNSEGAGGDIFIAAQDIEALGIDPASFFPSGITVAATSTGNAGNLTINTQRLRLRNGGRVDASTFAAGDAGRLTINASELIDISGTVPGSINPTLIASSANVVDAALAAFLTTIGINVPTTDQLSGNAGGITINTPRLNIEMGAQVTVRNDGQGDAGELSVAAHQIRLFDKAGITASTEQGSGGNITLSVSESLVLSQESQLSAMSRGAGNGGNIDLEAPVIVSNDNSDIVASAVQGNGGRIAITAQVLIGAAARSQRTSASDITASSQFGISGEVTLTNPEVDPSEASALLPTEIIDLSGQIVAGCEVQTNQFVASGQGGLPPNPTHFLHQNRLWADIRNLSLSEVSRSARQPRNEHSQATRALTNKTEPQATETQITGALVEARHWEYNATGDIVLVAENESLPHRSSVGCLADFS